MLDLLEEIIRAPSTYNISLEDIKGEVTPFTSDLKRCLRLVYELIQHAVADNMTNKIYMNKNITFFQTQVTGLPLSLSLSHTRTLCLSIYLSLPLSHTQTLSCFFLVALLFVLLQLLTHCLPSLYLGRHNSVALACAAPIPCQSA